MLLPWEAFKRITMHLLTGWEGWTGVVLLKVRTSGPSTKRSVGPVRLQAKSSLIQPDFTQSNNMTIFFFEWKIFALTSVTDTFSYFCCKLEPYICHSYM